MKTFLKAFLLMLIFVTGTSGIYAQRTVTGTVRDTEKQPIVGANVIVKGTSIGTITTIDGKYTLNVPSQESTIVVSFIGMVTQEIAAGSNSIVDVILEQEATSLDEVVVTALGIKREAKSLGYSATQVNTQQFSTTRLPNMGNSLIGKIAGLNVTTPPSGPGGTSKIRIRGQSSFGGNNSPLIVVNGIPIDNTPSTGSNNVDLGDGLQSINPDDIESMTVLKGASAAALYGFRAKDGVIIITTKSGAGQKGIGLELSSSFQADQALDYTDYQYEYGQGENGIRPANLSDARRTGVWSFGTKFDGLPAWQVNGTEQPYLPFKDRIKAFYNTGINLTNTVAMSGGDANGSFRLSVTDNNSTSIVPGTKYDKKIFDLGLNYKLTEKLSGQVNANYSIENNHNPPALGGQDFVTANTIYTIANSIDPRWLETNYKDENGNEIAISRFTNRSNPYWTMNERFEDLKRDRLFGNVSLRYQFLPWLYAQGRVGQDYYSLTHDFNTPTGTAFVSPVSEGFNGGYTQESRRFREINMDFLISANKTFGSFGVGATFGGNSMEQSNENLSTAVTNFYVRDLYTINNGQIKSPSYSYSRKKVNSLYGTVDLSFKDYLFLNLTGRNDWFSTLNPESNSYLYPSVSTSFLFTQAFKDIMPEWFDYGKVRVAYAEVGGDTDPYTNNLFYTVNTNTFNGIALGDISGSVSPNPNLRPLKVKEAEVGLETYLFDRRITLDLAAYRKNTVDEILNVDISNASGYSQTKVNVGRLRNQGIEALLTLVPVRRQNFSWETSFNYTYNISKVLELANGQQRIDVGTGDFIGTTSQEVGLPMGSIRGIDYKRDDQGRIITSNGRFLAGDYVTYGSAIPKHVGGWLNTFTYKVFRVFGQIDFKGGHKLISNTNFNLLRHGLTKSSLVGREGGVVFEGYNVDGTPNETPVEAEAFYADYRGKYVVTPFVYNASFIRFRTLSVGADLTKFVSGTFIKGLSLSGNINNFFIIKKYVDNLDPESVYSASDNKVGLESSGLPTTRSYGVSLNVKF
jgi:TonB-linked SusC/RagA family outer membrane protein